CWIDRASALQSECKRQIVVRRQRALQVQAVAAPARSAFDDQRLRRSLTSQGEIKAIVRREVPGHDIDRATVRTVVQIEPGKLDHTRVAAVETDVALLYCLIVDLEIDLD